LGKHVDAKHIDDGSFRNVRSKAFFSNGAVDGYGGIE